MTYSVRQALEQTPVNQVSPDSQLSKQLSTHQPEDYVRWFRNAAPYINSHQGKTMVLMFGGEAVDHDNFINIVHDIALLSSLGIRLVIVHGARPQIANRINDVGINSTISRGLRVTDKAALKEVTAACGALRIQIEAMLTTGLINSPMHGARLRVQSGNYVIAKPMGVVDGVDFQHTGLVRRIDAEGINASLAAGNIVLLSPVGYSTTGEVFNIALEDIAVQTAVSLGADKLIGFSEQQGVMDTQGNLIKSCSSFDLRQLLHEFERNQNNDQHDEPTELLYRAIVQASEQGVPRCHCVSYQQETALLQELFTRDGSGTLIAKQHDEQFVQASIDDVGGILELIQPLEQSGVLVRRSRKRLETEIETFSLIKKEGVIIACAALLPFDTSYIEDNRSAELACVVTHPDYRKEGLGERLLSSIERKAREQQINSLFVLTTVSEHWFREHGFVESNVDELPQKKQELYNFQRNSKVLKKDL